MLSQIAPLSQLGFSVNLGSGQQYISWIHITDVVRIILFCMENESISGPINCVSPSAISVSIFADAVKKATNALLVIRIPYLLLRLIFGEGEQILTSSQNCRPSKLSRSGYEFMFPELGHSLAQEFGHHHVSIRRFSGSSEAISGQATTTNPPGNAKYELRTEVILNSNAATIFSFFSSPKNLGLTTPPWVNFRILSMPPSVVCESEIAYKIRLAMVPMKWVTRIVDWQPETRFVDVQQSGPYRIWWHEHRIIEIDKSSSYLTDWVVYRLPFGILGKIIHRFFIKRALILIFSYRRRVLKYRFNSVP